jgi:hypothetical protein
MERASDGVKTGDRFRDSGEAGRFKKTVMVTVMVTGAIPRIERALFYRLYFWALFYRALTIFNSKKKRRLFERTCMKNRWFE